MRWTDATVRAALGLTPASSAGTEYTTIGTDTRALQAGALFVALRGERFDGHNHLAAAQSVGAHGAIVRMGTSAVAGLVFYEVPDTVRALGALAQYRRASMRGPVVAITGTNGKTSTKEMIAALLRTKYRTYATRANLNNLIGVPLTILEAPDDVEALVVEAGASVPGEISRYRAIIAPDLTVITTVSHGHVEGFGSLASVLEEKLDLATGVPLVVVGSDPAALAQGARQRAGRVITAGLSAADVAPDTVALTAGGRPRFSIDGVSCVLGVPGLHQVGNAMCAWAVGRELGILPSKAASALTELILPGGRAELEQHGALTILNDSYNANPQSFRAAIALAEALREDRRLVFVAGTMRELGPEGETLHLEVARELRALGADVLVAIGEFATALDALGTRPGSLVEIRAPDAATAAPLVAGALRGDELIVLKASRGVALERILPALVARAAPAP